MSKKKGEKERRPLFKSRKELFARKPFDPMKDERFAHGAISLYPPTLVESSLTRIGEQLLRGESMCIETGNVGTVRSTIIGFGVAFRWKTKLGGGNEVPVHWNPFFLFFPFILSITLLSDSSTRVRLVFPSSYFSYDRMRVTTFAGGRKSGFRDGKLLESLFHQPRGLCLDREGNLLVADTLNHCIRRIDTRSGTVITIAGTGKPGFVDGNALTEARFHDPTSLVVREDIIYVCDANNGAIRRIENGTVSTLAKGFDWEGIALDTNGDVLVADHAKNSVFSIDRNSGSVRRLYGDFELCYKIAVSSDGIIYVVSYNGNIAYWNGENWKMVARVNALVEDLVVDSFNNLLYLEFVNNRVKRINLSNRNIRLFAGSDEGNSDGPLLESRFRCPSGIAMDRSCIYISDCFNHTIRRISILGLWNRGKIDTTRFPISARKPFSLSFEDEGPDSNSTDPLQEKKGRK